jgi:hypothetical protein
VGLIHQTDILFFEIMTIKMDSLANLTLAPAVAIDQLEQSPSTPSAESVNLENGASIIEMPPHRSHDSQTNLKRSDPFQFGSRYLTDGDDMFEFNAWDHVETDDAYKEFAEQQFQMQRQSPVNDYDKCELSVLLSYIFSFSLWTLAR